MDADELQQVMRRLQELDHRTFCYPTVEKRALIAHIIELSKVTIRVCVNENQGADDAEEGEAIIKAIGMESVLDTTLTSAYKAAEELQAVLERANGGGVKPRYPVIGQEERSKY